MVEQLRDSLSEYDIGSLASIDDESIVELNDVESATEFLRGFADDRDQMTRLRRLLESDESGLGDWSDDQIVGAIAVRLVDGRLSVGEITEMPLDLQTKLLRVLEKSKMVRVGGSEEIAIDVRVLTASNHAPETIIRDRRLREDLYYRLAVFVVRLPPLRQRADDIELLARLFLERLNREYGIHKEFAPGALALARTHSWPGNVRELKNCVERSFVLGDNVITLDLQPAPAVAADDDSCVRIPIGTTLAETERAVLLATLRHCGGSKRRTAEMLGVSVKTIYNKVVGLHEESLPASAASRGEAPVRIGVPCLLPPNNGHSILPL